MKMLKDVSSTNIDYQEDNPFNVLILSEDDVNLIKVDKKLKVDKKISLE